MLLTFVLLYTFKCLGKQTVFVELRIDNCDERRVYKLEDISGPKGGTYMFNTSPKSSDFCLSNDV